MSTKDRAINNYWKNYHCPESIDEAVQLLTQYQGQARIIGGGTDLLLEIQQGRQPAVEALVDTSKISGLDRISVEDGYIVIGCAATHSQITQDPAITQGGTCLVEGCGVIGGPQVRNVGTLAGNVAHALPAGDGTIGLMALDGEIEIADVNGRHWIPLQKAFIGPGQSTIDHHRALLSRLRFVPTGQREGSAFARIMRPQGVALPMIAMAARLRLNEADHIVAARICIGPAGPVPGLAHEAMQALMSGPASKEQFEQASATALNSLALRDSRYRASRAYRREMVRTWLPTVLNRAAERARSEIAVPVGIGQ
jgi:carbon-monoxide dehydrogenase medium subunit